MGVYIERYTQANVIRGRDSLIDSLTEIYDMTARGEEIPALVDFLLENNYLSSEFFATVEDDS
jgi:hypothetical protein